MSERHTRVLRKSVQHSVQLLLVCIVVTVLGPAPPAAGADVASATAAASTPAAADAQVELGGILRLAPPGACAKPRRRRIRTSPLSFAISGTPTSRFAPSPVSASFPSATDIRIAMEFPPPEAPTPPDRGPCDVGSLCQDAMPQPPPVVPPPFIEPPPVSVGPPGT